MTIYQVILKNRLEKKISQSELARRSGVKQRNISYWESGQGNPAVNDCLLLAKGLGMTLPEFLAGVDGSGLGRGERYVD